MLYLYVAPEGILNILGVYIDLKQKRKMDLWSEENAAYFKHAYFNYQN